MLLIVFYNSCSYRNLKLKIALATLTGAPIAVAKEAINIPPIAADKIIKILSKQSNAVIYLLSLLLTVSLLRMLNLIMLSFSRIGERVNLTPLLHYLRSTNLISR